LGKRVNAGRRRIRLSLGSGAFALFLLALGPAAASAVGPPILPPTFPAWASQVFTGTARLNAQVDPNGFSTAYHFDYIAEPAYEANLAAGKDGFTGAAKAPIADQGIGSGAPVLVQQQIQGLTPDAAYAYRVKASNSAGTTIGPDQFLATRAPALTAGNDNCPNKSVRNQQHANSSPFLPDCRAYEMVSPIDKNGGDVAAPGAVAGGGATQAAIGASSATYSSSASFAGGQGAPPASQYIAIRSSSGWATINVTVPLFAGSYGTNPNGVPYRLFSADLSRGLLLNGRHCRGDVSGCAVPNPPLGGTDAPAGYQNYYLRDPNGGFEALLGSADIAGFGLDPADFELRFAGATPDLTHVILVTCSRLTASATDGCSGLGENLYEWSPGAPLALLNSSPGAALAAQSGAISADGSRVYLYEGGNLRLRGSGALKQVDADAGGGGTFEVASADGSVAFFTKGTGLWRYLAADDSATQIAGGVSGVLGVSQAGDYLYFQDASGLQRWHGGSTTQIAPGTAADVSNFPAAIGTARVSADGTKLLFVSSASLTGYDNTDLNANAPDSQVFLYDGTLRCISCNPTGARPIGPSSIPGAIANGTDPEITRSYKPRALSADGRRVYFDSSDAIALTDTNNTPDVYQWEAQGSGDCNRAEGCVSLISSGRTGGGTFADASADGSDALFLTAASLISDSAGNDVDPGSVDLYDARAGGGFLIPPAPIPCQGDACQVLPPEPSEPTLTTLLAGPGNPPPHYTSYGRKGKKKGGKRKHSHSHRRTRR
jgi:hypothetical protein